MSLGYAFLVGFLPLFATTSVSIFLDHRKTGLGIMPGFVALVVLTLPGFGIPFAWDFDWRFGLLFGILAYSVPLLLTVALFADRWTDPLTTLASRFLLGSMLCSIVTPAINLQALRSGPTEIGPVVETIQSVTSIPLIRERFSDLEQLLQVEGEKIQVSLESVFDEVEKQNVELQELRAEEQRLKAELETYKKLLELDEPKVQAIRSLLNRGKYLDYGVGLLLGVLSSAAVAYSSSLLGRRRELREVESGGSE